jgi:hypothetical protein
VKPSLLGDHEIELLADRLDIALPHAIGMLEILWIAIQRQQDRDDQVDGLLRGWDARDVARACRWKGDAEELLDALHADGKGWFLRDERGVRAARWASLRPRHLDVKAKRIKDADGSQANDVAHTGGHDDTCAHTGARERKKTLSSPLLSSPEEENPPVAAGAATTPRSA